MRIKRDLENRGRRKWKALKGSRNQRRPKLFDDMVEKLGVMLRGFKDQNDKEIRIIKEGIQEENMDIANDVNEQVENGRRSADVIQEVEEDDVQAEVLNVNSRVGKKQREHVKGIASENVVNLSVRKLTDSDIRVFSKGLNFCPTPREVNRFELVKDLTEFGRRMKCRAYFGLDGESDRQCDKRTHFKEKSKWCPEVVDQH